jgi:hypothetical protein
MSSLLYNSTGQNPLPGVGGYNNQISTKDPFENKNPFGKNPFSTNPITGSAKQMPTTMFPGTKPASPSIKPVTPIASVNTIKSIGLASPTNFKLEGETPKVAVDKLPKQPSDFKMDPGAIGAATSTGLNLAASAVGAGTYDGTDDPTRYTKKDARNDMKKDVSKGMMYGSSAASAAAAIPGVATGLSSALGVSLSLASAAIPIAGVVIAGLGFAISSILKRKNKKKQAKRNEAAAVASLNSRQMMERRNQLQTGGDTSVNEAMPTSYGATQIARKGGILYNKSNRAVKAFKKGGVIKEYENVIPNGVLHEEENELGDKGMPVVKCTQNVCKKKYEIEKDELIFTHDTTKTVERLARSNNHKALGNFVKEQLLDNTHSFTDKYKELNNM